MPIILLGSFILIAIFDKKTILKNRDRRSQILYFALLTAGFVINLLLMLDKAPPSPTVYIERFVKLFVP